MFGLFGRNKQSKDIEEVIEEPVERRFSDRNDTYADAIALTEKGRFLKKELLWICLQTGRGFGLKMVTA